MKSLYLIGLFSWLSSCLLSAQGNCNDPIVLNSVLVSNSVCGASTGTVIITPSGAVGLYTFTWQPPVSNTNIALGLPASTYNVRIERATNPACRLDTLIVVNNSNGPQVQANISPAQCLADNGAISLTPSHFNYQWSTGATGSSVSGLASKNYYVTVTDPGTGCYSIFKYFVPRNFNSLNVSALVQADAKCGMSNGRAQVLVVGGSGQYTYAPGPGPQYNNLPAGNYTVQVTDNATGCFGFTSFAIQDLPVSGTVHVVPHDVRCFGQTNGYVEFNVSAGPNFALPYVFTLKDSNGTSFSPGSLPAGNYFLQISDADGCALPVQPFSIKQPPTFQANAVATPEVCQVGGRIDLQISGGNGSPYYVDWTDLPGSENPKDRANLLPGFYAATVYDSLFCTASVSNVFIAPQCNNTTQVHVVLPAGTTDIFCVPRPVGLAPGATNYTLLGGGTVGSSAFGSWLLSSDGCLSYTAGNITGFALDKICVVGAASAIAYRDTFCIVVSIAQGAIVKSTVFFTTQVNASATACGSIPPYVNNRKVLQIGRPGLNGISDAYGTYDLDSQNACIAFFAASTPGANVDEIKVAVFDTLLHRCALFSYFPSILPKINCPQNLIAADTLKFVSVNCNGISSGCIPIPLDNMVNYTVLDNGGLYSLGYEGCSYDTLLRYNVSSLPLGGPPYKLLTWMVDGQNYSGHFFDIGGLVDLMNLLDAVPFSWTEQAGGLIRGGDRSKAYGPLVIQSASGTMGNYPPSLTEVPLGTRMRFASGIHQLVFRNTANACADTVVIDALCVDCPPIHSYPLNAGGQVRWETGKCGQDTIFCTNIPNSQLGQYQITDNGQPFFNFDLCGNFVGMRLDTGLHELHFKHLVSVCEWSVKFRLECKSVLNQQTISILVPVDFGAALCLDTTLVPGTVTSVNNVCPVEGVSNISWSVDPTQWCVWFSAQTAATDTLCLLLCDNNGQCALFTVIAQGVFSLPDSLLAVNDFVFSTKNQTVDFPIIANDIVGGVQGNLGGLKWVEFLTAPQFGIYVYNPLDGSISYTPNPGVCGEDSIVYRITDFAGQVSTATIKITISCDKILVFKGISPNGDGKNDLWHIVGIEQFPNNTVQVFNRWGNLVFEQKNYRNDQGWDGQWNGKDLPDGTYFYVIDLGNGQAEKISGWLQLVR